MAMELTDDNFDTEVLQANEPVLVDFWAEWCQPCRMLSPTIDELATDFAGRAKVGKLDTDGNRQVAMKYGVNSIPTVMIFKGGEMTKKFVGITPMESIQEGRVAPVQSSVLTTIPPLQRLPSRFFCSDGMLANSGWAH